MNTGHIKNNNFGLKLGEMWDNPYEESAGVFGFITRTFGNTAIE